MKIVGVLLVVLFAGHQIFSTTHLDVFLAALSVIVAVGMLYATMQTAQLTVSQNDDEDDGLGGM